MGALKQIASSEDLKLHKKSIRFYKSFMSSVRRHGRVHEMEFMTLFFLSMKDPFLPLTFTPLGMKLMGKGKVALRPEKSTAPPLDALFDKVADLERTAAQSAGKEGNA